MGQRFPGHKQIKKQGRLLECSLREIFASAEATVFCTFVPKQKYQKFSTQKEGMARHQQLQKRELQRVCADFPSFAVEA